MPPHADDFLTFDWTERLWSTGRIALSAGHLGFRRLVGLSGDADAEIGQELAEELDRMKGMAMKVGQILSYFDGVLPEDTHAALRSLQLGVTSMSAGQVRELLEAELGEPVESLFDQFDPKPVASASVGQVHRGRLGDSDVAVKIQYPGIRDSIDADFRRLRRIGRLVSFMPLAVDGEAIVDELRDRVLLECDYQAEARHQALFRDLFGGDPAIDVPAVVPERTGPTVITSAWAEGLPFYEFARTASPAHRTEAARALLRFAYRSFFGLGVVNADPHPGNYVFPGDGRIVLLDFGCVRRFDPAFVEGERALVRTVLDGRRAAFDDALIATGIVEEPRYFDFDRHWNMMRHMYAPFIAGRFRFDLDFVRTGLEHNGPTNPNLMRLRIPPAWVWLQRLQWGLHAVLARLGAEGSFRDLFREQVEGPLEPPETSDG